MAVHRIEVAIECDDALGEGMDSLSIIVESFGLDPSSDVEVILSATDDGNPALVAVLAKGANSGVS